MTNESNLVNDLDREHNLSIVVVADDDRDNLVYISLILDALNITYYLANDGKAALELVNQKQPDLVLLDIVMPILNGIEVNTTIKASQSTRLIPTVAITGLTQPEQIVAIENAGFNDYIIKPFLIEDLETILESWLKVG